MTKLGKPPVVEVWFLLELSRSAESPPWNLETALDFADQFKVDFPGGRMEHSHDLQIDNLKAGRPALVSALERIQLFDTGESRCLQYRADAVAYNCLREGRTYPGFEVVYEDAERFFERYVEFFRPMSIASATVCYADVVNIPLDGRPMIELNEYIKFGVEFDENIFGPIQAFNTRFKFTCPLDGDPMALAVQPLPTDRNSEVIRLHMEWQKTCSSIDSLDLREVKRRIVESKNYLWECFKRSFTPEGWALFDPEEIAE